jgi:hypothetical protein
MKHGFTWGIIMNSKSNTILSKLKLIFLILYFLILFAERLLAVALSIWMGGEYALNSGNVFNYIAYGITAVSVVAGLVLMLRVLPKMFASVFTKKEYDFNVNYKLVVIAAMAILFGGMMHTGFTVAPVQFVAYGFLIASMVVRTIKCCREMKKHSFASIISVIYLTLLAMAVPVSYISFQTMPMRAIFFAVEFAAVFVLVPVFGIMLLKFYETGVTSFSFVYPLLVLVFSGLTVALKWTEEINWFVLIFLVLTVIFYLSFGLIAKAKERKGQY